MKASSLFAAALIVTVTLFYSQSYAQSTGVAADKQKQAALDKQRAHQAELKRKYNSLTPEQAAEARKRSAEYKKGGYKNKEGQKAERNTVAKPGPAPAGNANKPGVILTKPAQRKPVNTNERVGAKTKPIMMDANGKPLNKTAPAVTPSNKVVTKVPATKTNSAEKAAVVKPFRK